MHAFADPEAASLFGLHEQSIPSLFNEISKAGELWAWHQRLVPR